MVDEANQAAVQNLQQQTQSPLPSTDPQSQMTTLTPYNIQTQAPQQSMYMPMDMNALMGATDPESEKLQKQAIQKYSDALDDAGRDAKATRRADLAERIAGHIAAIGLGAAGGGAAEAGQNVLERVHQDSQDARQRQQGLEQQRLGALKNLVDIHNTGHLKAFLEAEKDQRAAKKIDEDRAKEAGRNSRADARMNFNKSISDQRFLIQKGNLGVAQGNLAERKLNDTINSSLRAEGLNDTANQHQIMNKFKDDYLGLAYSQYKNTLLNQGREAAEKLLKNDEGMQEAAERHSLDIQKYNKSVRDKAEARDPITHQLMNPDAQDPTKPADFSGYLLPEESADDLVKRWKGSIQGRAGEEALQALAAKQAQPAPMPNAQVQPTGARINPMAMRGLGGSPLQGKPKTAAVGQPNSASFVVPKPPPQAESLVPESNNSPALAEKSQTNSEPQLKPGVDRAAATIHAKELYAKTPPDKLHAAIVRFTEMTGMRPAALLGSQ